MKLQKIGTKLEKQSKHSLYEAFAALKDEQEVINFLEDLCTPAELQAMADRWKVVGLIKSGKSYRQIYEETGVSVTTVGRVARCILFGEGGYNSIYERLESKKNADKKQIKNSNPKKRAPE